jgi:hypothetical protein
MFFILLTVACGATSLLILLAFALASRRGSSRAHFAIDCNGGDPRNHPHVARMLWRLLAAETVRLFPLAETSCDNFRISREWLRADLTGALDFALSSTALALGQTAVVGAQVITAAHAATFAAVEDVLCDPTFPFRLLGSVHMRSTLTLYEGAFAADARSDASCHMVRLSPAWRSVDVVAAWDPVTGVRPHKRGTEVDVVVSVVRSRPKSSEVSSVDDVLWRSVATFLVFSSRKQAARGVSSGSLPPAKAVAPRAAWELAQLTVAAADELAAAFHADDDKCPARNALHASVPLALQTALAGAWSQASGDYNPIHLHWLAARLFGFSGGRVAHGMSVIHAALPHVVLVHPPPVTAMEPGNSASYDGNGSAALSSKGALQVAVTFARPLMLPSSQRICVVDGAGATSRPAVHTVGFFIASRAMLKPSIAGFVSVTSPSVLATLVL